MEFSISSIFPEPGISFKVSYKVKKLIANLIKDNIVNKVEFEHKYKGFRLGIIISTESSRKAFEVKGPDISKRFRTVDYAVWIPYSEVVNSENMLEIYIDYVFKGIQEVFFKEQIEGINLNKIKTLIKDEVLNNVDYAYLEGR